MTPPQTQSPRHSGVALITGGARRIGAVLARRLALAGYAVAIHCHASRAEADALAAEITAAGGRAAACPADLANVSTLQGLCDSARDALGPLTLLINNAALFEPDTFETLTAARYETQLAVNLRAPLFLSQAFARALPEGMDGAIVNIIDQRVWRLNPNNFSYTLSKAALWSATQTMAQALAPRIRVNAVGPGPSLPNARDGAPGLAHEARHVLLRREVPPDEIADAVLYLARARSVTGAMIAVDAGQHLSWRTRDVTGE